MNAVWHWVLMVAVVVPPAHGAGNGQEYVEGYGWANSRKVAVCLQAVGEEDVDALTDWKWDDWLGCMGAKR